MTGTTGRADVCVIGAGVAGGLVAYELGRAGWKVVVLEAGPRHDPKDRFSYMQEYLDGKDPWKSDNPERDVFTNAGSFHYPLNGSRVKAVGGTTLHWGGNSPRLHETDFRMRALHGIGEDWPITYDELEPYYCKAEAALGVSGAADNPFASRRSADYPLPPFPFSYGDGVIIKACDRIGIRTHPVPHAKNSRAYQGRPACQRYSACEACPIQAQYNGGVHVRMAEQTGNVTVIDRASVVRIVESGDRVTGAVYVTPDRAEHFQEAKVVVLAAHAVESARLLLLSKSGRFPEGLANQSGLVGKNFMEHICMSFSGRVREPLFPYRIGFHTVESWQYYATRRRDKVAAFKLEFFEGGPRPVDIAEESGDWGEPLKSEVRERFGRTVTIGAMFEQPPNEHNSVTLDPVVRDCFGNPAPRITFGIGEYERGSAKAIEATMLKIFDALGASDVQFDLGQLGTCAHHLGTCRMGNNPETSVVDRNLKAHGLENLYIVGSGVFVTEGAMNPTLTIAALAIRAGEHILAVGRRAGSRMLLGAAR